MRNDLIKTTEIVNGFFYSFDYKAKNNKIYKGFDPTPFIYCVGPSLRAENSFIGLNLHQLNVKERYTFIEKFQKKYKFMNDNIRHVLSEKSINSLLPGCLAACREYRRQAVENACKVINKMVPAYIGSSNNLIMEKPNDLIIERLIKAKLYQKDNNQENKANTSTL